MPDFPTFSDYWTIARNEALSRNSRLTADIIDRRGSDANAMVAAGVAVGDAVTGQLIRVSADLFLDTAKKSALDRLVWDRYQLLRTPASPAVGEVEVTTATPAAAGFTITVGTQFTSDDGRAFEATEEVLYPVGSSGPITVPIQSVLTGLDQQAATGTINKGQFTGAPADVSVTNALATAGADNEESDEHLRDRAKRFYTTSQRGTLAAIERRALEVSGVRRATATEVIDADGAAARLVDLVVADAFTDDLVDASVVPSGYQTQSTQLALSIDSAVLDTRAAGIQVVVTIASVYIMGITMLLRYRAGVDVAATREAARARAVAYTNSLDPGETFVVDDLEALLETVPGLNVLGGEVVSPTTDQPASTLQVWRTATDKVVIGTASD